MDDESGMGTVEIILIIVVLIGLVIVFKKEIDGLVTEIFKTINSDAAKVTG
ncbi:Flp1 family type IVb pilin [Butyrivibrio sp. JL13D10]|uniref:Flp1 family type IVb pilin n=1 Tax=Butyrivibrio sp. JL13D10 TaxID=3236815 RepID=UPI0038B4B929